MNRVTTLILLAIIATGATLLAIAAPGCNKTPAPEPRLADDTPNPPGPKAPEPKAADVTETKYLTFQLMTTPGATIPMAFAENGPSTPTKGQMEAFVREIVKAIGTTGDARHKLGFVPTHFPFDMSDEDTRRVIQDAFAIARENDVAVAFHLDDCMYWGKRKVLMSNPDNIETADWKQIPSTGRRVDYRPGFSTYPEGRTFKEVHAVLEKHGSPGWISAEGTNVSPTSMPGASTMETYLGRVFNHGGVMVTVFSWGIGGEAQRNNFFRRATENPEALGAYAKFLRGEQLVESAATGFSSESFHAKMERIQKELPAWIQKNPGQQAKATALMEKIKALAKDKKWQEVDKTADDILSLISSGEKK